MTAADSLLSMIRLVLARTGWKAAAAVVFLLLGSLTEGISVVLLIPILRIAGSAPGDAGSRGTLSTATSHIPFGLAGILCVFVAVVVLRAVLMRTKDIAIANLLYGVINQIRTALFSSIAFARWGFIATLRTADLDHALSAEIDRVHLTIYQVFQLAQSLILLGIYGVISLFISPWMTLFAAGFGALLFAVMRPVRRAASQYGALFTEQHQRQYRVIADFITGIKVAKSFNTEPDHVLRLAGNLEETRGANIRLAKVTANGALISQFISAGGMAVFAYVALTDYHLAFSKIIILLFAFMRMAPRIASVQDSLHQIIVNLPAYETMRALQDRCANAQEIREDSGTPTPNLAARLSFRAVDFAHRPDGPASLADATFEIPAYRITALIGPSGAGKSTIADLIMGLIEPTAGEVLVDGQPLGAANRRAWRGQVAYVPQDVFLTHASIFDNLRIAKPDADEARMWQALEDANAAVFVRALPDGLATVVGERGLRLSGGERQRIALARALLRRPQLLILDEGTSALDWENQAMVARSIERLRGRMTVLTIAHRPSMIAFADWVVGVAAGRIVETGPYADILSRPDSQLARIIAEETMPA